MKTMKKTLTIASLGLILSVIFPAIAQAQTALDDLQKNGVLRVGIRQDAPPFGVLENQKWNGLCVAAAEQLKTSLEKKLNRPIRLEKLVTVSDPSSVQNRFKSVTSGRTHLECGPNTILKNPPQGVAFSQPFLYSGTYFLVSPQGKLLANPSGFMPNVTIGVLSGTLTQELINSRYQLAPKKVYEGVQGRAQGVRDAIDGKIDVFAGDRIVLVGEALRLGFKPEQFSIIPNEPLSCVSYGMILPANDSAWIKTINNFIDENKSTELLEKVYGKDSPFLNISVFDQDKCI
jgi:polar amino acid transport system substrate-binding protein